MESKAPHLFGKMMRHLLLIQQGELMIRLLVLSCLFVSAVYSRTSKPVYTQVTFMYDIKREDLNSGFKRPFSFYLSYFEQLLATSSNLIIFTSHELKDYVLQRRKEHNTVFVEKQLESFKKLWYSQLMEKCRQKFIQDPEFKNIGLPQYGLQDYNTIMFAKLYLMTEAVRYDKWNTDFLIWTDGGYMHQFPRSIISPQNIVKKFYQLVQPSWVFFTYYEYQNTELFLGYEKGELRYIDRKAMRYEYVLASNMGGSIHILRDIKCAFESLVRITLQYGDMNSDETPFTLMPIKYPFLIPSTTNIFLNNFFNKFHIYEDVNRIALHPRFWTGRIDAGGKLEVTANINSTRSNNKRAANESMLITSLQEAEKMSAIKHRKVRQLYKIRQLFSISNVIDRSILHMKFASFGAIVLVYILLIICNKKIKCFIDKNTKAIGEIDR